MKVLLTGATGFVGSAIRDALLAEGHQLVAAVRRAHSRAPLEGVAWREADFVEYRTVEQWLPLLYGVQAVVNAVGIIRETSRLKFQVVHTDAPCALFSAAKSCGVQRLVQISASGLRENSPYEYFRTKAQTERFLAQECVERSLILRPSLVYGAQGEATQLFRRLAALPLVPLPAGGDFAFRPILVEDLAQLVVESLQKDPFPTGVFEVGGADILSLRQLLIAVRAWSKGQPPDSPQWREAPTLTIPLAFMKPAAWAGDLTGLGPIDSSMLGMLLESEAPDIGRMSSAFEATPRGLLTFLKGAPR